MRCIHAGRSARPTRRLTILTTTGIIDNHDRSALSHVAVADRLAGWNNLLRRTRSQCVRSVAHSPVGRKCSRPHAAHPSLDGHRFRPDISNLLTALQPLLHRLRASLRLETPTAISHACSDISFAIRHYPQNERPAQLNGKYRLPLARLSPARSIQCLARLVHASRDRSFAFRAHRGLPEFTQF